MEMETLLHGDNINALDLVASLVVETALCAQKSFLCLLLVTGSQSNGRNTLTGLMAADQRFPFADLTSVRDPVAENKDAGETDITESDDDDDEEEDEEEDNESEEEKSDRGEDSDDDADTNGDSGSGDDDDDNDEDDDSDDDEEDNDEDDDDEDDEEEEQPPAKKKK